MKTKRAKKVFAMLMIFSILCGNIFLSSLGQTTVVKAADTKEQQKLNEAAPLIVTEVAPANAGGHRTTFVEIYNNSNSLVNFGEYYFYYWYTTSVGKTWQTDDMIIQPGQTIVLWLNDGAKKDTVDTFNEYFGVNLTEGKDIFAINYAGFHATAKRGFLFGMDEDNIIAECWVNVNGADITDVNVKESVHYVYPGSGNVSNKSHIAKATPGTVDSTQVPETRVDFDITVKPEITILEAPGTAKNTDEITIRAKVDGTVGALKTYLNYSCDKEIGYQSIEMVREAGTNIYTATIPNAQIWSNSIDWNIKSGYGGDYYSVTSDSKITVTYDKIPAEKKTPFTVTEVVLPPDNSGNEYAGNNQFSYVELYNATNSPVNYKYYHMYYEYTGTATATKTWDPSDPVIFVQPGETLILWLTDNGSTVEQFNQYYGVNLEEGKDIVKINYAGFHNTQSRTLLFGRSVSNYMVKASFNENNTADTDRSGNQSIQYTYPRTEENRCIPVTNNTPPTPGSVALWQVPETLYSFSGYENYPADNGGSPNVSLNGELPEFVQEGNELFLAYDIADSMGLVGMQTFYRLDGTGEWIVLNEAKQRVSYNYFLRIPADEMFGHDYIEFYVVGNNNYRATRTQTYKLDIKKLNDINGVRLNLSNGQIIGKTATITANDGADNANTKIYIDDKEVSAAPVLENGAYFAITSGGRDTYFKNAVTGAVPDDPREVIAYMAKWGADCDNKLIHVDNKYFTVNENGNYEVVLTVWAGDSGTPFEDIFIPSENHEDYTVTNLRLRLANGNEYIPVEIGPNDSATSAKTNLSTATTAIHTVGDSAGMCPYMNVKFEIPKEQVTAVGYTVDTTRLSDGEHVIKAVSGASESTVKVIVDNTAPKISIDIEEGQVVTGELTIDPTVTDASYIENITVLLDGEEIQIPYKELVRTLSTGTHTVTVLAVDTAGNTATQTRSFLVENVNPEITDASTEQITSDFAALTVKLGENNLQDALVEFYEGKQLSFASGDIVMTTGTGDSPLAQADNGEMIVNDLLDNELPYQMFTMNTGDVQDTDNIVVNWNGTVSNADNAHAVKMYALNYTENRWDVVGTPDEEGNINAAFLAKDYAYEEQAYILVQCRAEMSDPTTETEVSNTKKEGTFDWDGTGMPESYDFSLAWITDTQYYSESWPQHYKNQNQWIVDNADKLNIKYVMHTGDIVDEYDQTLQWERADAAMKIFDDAKMPYGVLAGNHDVAAGNMIYENYGKYFGEKRFNTSSVYAGGYNNNAGHYDLATYGGEDMIFLYMSWDIYEDEINWMNQVLEQYKDRTAFILLHRYTNVSMKEDTYLDYCGKVLQEQVVAKNANVAAVLNGHYHGSSIETTAFDDDGDGIKERTVYQICTDYQSAPEGGQQYIKFLYFDIENNKIYMNSYSPLLNDFNYFDKAKLADYGDGTKETALDIFELDVDFNKTEKKLTYDYFSAGIQSSDSIGSAVVQDKKATVEYKKLSTDTEYTWYAVATNSIGGEAVSEFVTFKTTEAAAPEKPENPVPDDNNDTGDNNGTDDNNGTGDNNSTGDNSNGSLEDAVSGGSENGKETPDTGDIYTANPFTVLLATSGLGCVSAMYISSRKRKKRINEYEKQ